MPARTQRYGSVARVEDAEGQQVGLAPGGGPQGSSSPVAYWRGPAHRFAQDNDVWVASDSATLLAVQA